MRWLVRILSLRLLLTVALIASIGVAWTAWFVMPERPLREWRLNGPFGIFNSSIDLGPNVALVKTTTQPLCASASYRGMVCYLSSGPGPEFSWYLLDLSDGRFRLLGDELTGSRHPRDDEAMQRSYDGLQRNLAAVHSDYTFQEPQLERWWMAWRHTDEEWTLHDADSHQLLASNRCDPKTDVGKPIYTADHRWITIGEHRPRATENVIFGYLKRWLNVSLTEGEDLHLLVYDPATGRRVNDVPSWSVVRWTPDGNSFWTADTSYSMAGTPNGVTCRLWSPYAAGPPLWLLSWTVVGSLGVLPRSVWHSAYRRLWGQSVA